MARPQQRELARNEKVPALSPDATETVLTGEPEPEERGRTGPVPEDNLPGHHPTDEQDKPDGDAFLRKLQGEERPKESKKKASPKKKAPTARKVSGKVKQAVQEPEPVATTQATVTTHPPRSSGFDPRDVRDVALRLAFWPVTVGVWAGKQVLRRLQNR